MPIEKLEEFARDGQKNTDELILTDGFPRPKFPARQWFNYLFNAISLKINELIDLDPIARSEIVDDLTTNDSNKPVSAKQAKVLQDTKLGKTENAVSATKLATARTIAISGAVTGTATSFDGSGNIAIATTAIDGSKISTGTIPVARLPTLNQSTTGNAATATKLATPRTINGVNFDGTTNISIPTATTSVSGTVQLNNTLTSTSTSEAATANTVKLLNDQAFGVGQIWQDVKSSRISGTTYTNTTGRPIEVFIEVSSADTETHSIEVGGVILCSGDWGITGMKPNVSFTVPAKATYKFTSTTSILRWSELR